MSKLRLFGLDNSIYDNSDKIAEQVVLMYNYYEGGDELEYFSDKTFSKKYLLHEKMLI